MKKFFVAIGLSCVVASTLLVGCGDTATPNPIIAAKAVPVASGSWQLLSRPIEKFSVLMPGSSSEANMPHSTKAFVCDISGQIFSLLSSDTKAPALNPGQSSAQNLKLIVAAFSTDSNVQVMSMKDISLQGQLGKEIVYTMLPTQKQVKAHIFVANNRTYNVFVAAPADSFPTQSADYFLDSFTLLP